MASPSGAEKLLIGFLDNLDAEVRSFRNSSGFDRNADAWLKYRAGDAWSTRAEEPVFLANLLGNFIDRKVAQLTQSQPDIRVSARSPQLASSARVLTDTCRAVLDDQQFDARIETAGDLAATFGFVGFNTCWNPHAEYGQGAIQIQVLDPRRVFVDHHIKDVTEIGKAQYCRIDTPMPLDDIKRIWPGRGAEVRADADTTNFRDNFQSGSWFGSATKRVLRPTNMVAGPYEWAIVKEYWIRSTQTGDDGELLFPNGRMIHRAGNVILDDQPNPYWDGMWPVDVWDWRVNGDSYMGRSDVEEGRKLQEAINRIGNAITKNIILNSAITVIGDYNALSNEDWKRLDNRAARVLRKMPGRELNFVPPPPIPDTYMNFVTMLGSFMETLLGIPPSMQGKRQPGVIASSAIEGLMTQAETLIRATARRLEYVVERIGIKLISRVVQFFSSDRVLMIYGPDGDLQEYTFERAKLLGEYFEGKEEAEASEEIKEFFTNFRFRVTPLSSLPSNKVQRGLMAMQLLQAGLITPETALRIMEFPDYKAELQRAQQQNAARQQQDMQTSMQMQMMGMDPTKVPPKPGGGGSHGGRPNRDGTKLKL